MKTCLEAKVRVRGFFPLLENVVGGESLVDGNGEAYSFGIGPDHCVDTDHLSPLIHKWTFCGACYEELQLFKIKKYIHCLMATVS